MIVCVTIVVRIDIEVESDAGSSGGVTNYPAL